MKTLKIIIRDESAPGELICFNRPFLEKSLPVGSVIRVTGRFIFKYGNIQSSSFEAERLSSEGDLPGFSGAGQNGTDIPGSGVIPVYPLTAGLTQAAVRRAVKKALQQYGRGIEDELPVAVLSAHSLMTKQQAVRAMHMPQTLEEAQTARKTLIFEELFHFQFAMARRSFLRRGKIPSETDSPEQDAERVCAGQNAASFTASLSPRQKQLAGRLPFDLTPDQKTTLAEINADIDAGFDRQQSAKPYAMARLLQGDVGSGKTLVAFFACLRVADWGGQSAVLAPTELLARQHAENAAKLLEPVGVRLAFLTGNVKAEGRSRLLAALAAGDIDIVIGTHALFSKQVQYRNLKLAVIDEQHRFGVLQRSAIIEKGRRAKDTDNSGQDTETPHLLMMSATPIPRTLALTVFGDLDVSTIKTMPPGRKHIITHLARQGNEQKVYEYVREQLRQGRQAYFVYPLIDPAEQSDSGRTANLKSAEQMYETVSRTIYPEYRTALIHSRIDEAEQRKIMRDFRSGDIRILIATSVVEVGVDVPNATCMVIEHADRFGLSALHQLRGRVGRGEYQSYCFLIYGKNLTEEGKARLKVMHDHTDGFLIAEEDLKLRGPGEVSGIQQSGYLTLSIADPARDGALLKEARAEAFALAGKDPYLLSAEAAPVRELWKRAPPFRDKF